MKKELEKLIRNYEKDIKKLQRGDEAGIWKMLVSLLNHLQWIVDKEQPSKIPTWNDFKAYALQHDPLLDMADLRLKYDAWAVNDWKDGHDKLIKNWKAKLLQTIPYLKKVLNRSGVQPTERQDVIDQHKKDEAEAIQMLAEIRKESPDYDPMLDMVDRMKNLKSLGRQGSEQKRLRRGSR